MPTPDPAHDDEALAEALADAWVERAATDPHLAASLISMESPDDWEPPFEITSVADTARACGLSEATVCNISRRMGARLAAKILGDPASTPKQLRAVSRFLSRL